MVVISLSRLLRRSRRCGRRPHSNAPSWKPRQRQPQLSSWRPPGRGPRPRRRGSRSCKGRSQRSWLPGAALRPSCRARASGRPLQKPTWGVCGCASERHEAVGRGLPTPRASRGTAGFAGIGLLCDAHRAAGSARAGGNGRSSCRVCACAEGAPQFRGPGSMAFFTYRRTRLKPHSRG